MFQTPRPWIEDLYKKLTHAERTQLARKAALGGIEVSVKYRKSDGTMGVSQAQGGPKTDSRIIEARVSRIVMHDVSVNTSWLRHGGKDLRATQVYPDGFGRMVADQHKFLTDWRCICYFNTKEATCRCLLVTILCQLQDTWSLKLLSEVKFASNHVKSTKRLAGGSSSS